MKNLLLILTMTCLFVTTYGQKGKKEIITYTTEDGTNYTVGDSIHFGVGSNPNGNFRYANTLKSFVGGAARYYNRTLNYKFAIIDKMQQTGSDKMGYTMYFIFRYGVVKSAVMVESAISAGEMITPASKKKAEEKNKPIIIQQGGTSLADEIMKLKELLDLGILTQEEYDAQKQKLLNK